MWFSFDIELGFYCTAIENIGLSTLILGCLSPWKGQHIMPFRFTAKPYSSAACRVEMAFFTSEKTGVLPSVPMGGVQTKGRSPVRGVGEVGFIHTSIRQSVVHLTSCCGTAWLRSSLRKKASTFCCAVRSSRSSSCASL